MTPSSPGQPTTRPATSQLPGILFELAVIALIALLYFTYFLSAQPPGIPRDLSLGGLHPVNRFGGLEHERLAGVLLPVEIGLRQYGHVPTWNPYLNSGTPLINNAFNYLFNPFHSLPMLLFGGVQGSKLAVMLALLLAGWNMWALMKAVGVGRVARVTTGALYLLSGGIAAKFYTGHFQLGLSLAWPPLVLAGLWWTLRTTDRRAPALMAAAFALLFFAGNIYYTLHTLVACAFITALYALESEQGRWRIQWARLRRVVTGGLFAFGLSAVQFMPVWAVQAYISHERVAFAEQGHIDPALDSHYELTQAILNYVYPWERWNVFQVPPFLMDIVVDYAYIGPVAFLFIAALAGLTFLRPAAIHARPALAALALALVMMVWGAGQTPVLEYLYGNIDLLAQFRYLGRAHAIGALWWLVLAGIAIDTLWAGARALRPAVSLAAFNSRRLVILLLLAGLSWSWFLVFSLLDSSTRLQLALGIFPLYQWLGARVFTTYMHAADVLWWLLLIALALDWLMALGLWLLRNRRLGIAARLNAAHLARLVLVILLLTAVADLMEVNSKLLRFGVPVNNFDSLYWQARQRDTDNPFPIIQEPFSPSAFDGYYAGARNWLLNEGWTPRVLPDIIPPDAPTLRDMAGWGIVSNEYSGAAYELALAFVESHLHERIVCQPRFPAEVEHDPCDFESHQGAALYRLPEALPYAFAAPEQQILTAADTIASHNVHRVRVVSHQLDTIIIQASTPADDHSRHYLVVQEHNFPGWQAFIDGEPVAPVTIRRFVGIPMQPGQHTYTLRFQPPGFAAGLVISLATLVILSFYLRGGRPAGQAQ